MKAYQLVQWQQPPELREVDVPEPGPGEVLVRVAGAGACHSDLHLMEWPPGQVAFDPPFTLGHENAGWVAALGAGADGLAVGDAVVVYGPWGCGRCPACRLSRENYCHRQAEIGVAGGGLGLDGGMAEYLLVPSPRLLLALEDLDPRDAAPLTDAALTPYHAIKRALPILDPSSTVVVIGVGGLGHMAVQLLRALTAVRIVAVDVSERHRLLALEVGADVALASDEATAGEVRELTRGHGARLVLDLVGSDDTMALAVACAAAEGQVTVIGAAGGVLGWRAIGALPWACALTSTYWGSAVELGEVLDLARAGHLHARSQRFLLKDVGEAYAALRDGRLEGRAVVCPAGTGS